MKLNMAEKIWGKSIYMGKSGMTKISINVKKKKFLKIIINFYFSTLINLTRILCSI